jgi:hypothetical protein
VSVSVHLPASVVFTGELEDAKRHELERVLLTAISRAVASVSTGDHPAGDASARPASPAVVGEPLDPLRYDPRGGSYAVPSYDDRGALQPVPIVPAEAAEDRTERPSGTEAASKPAPAVPAEAARDRVVEGQSVLEGRLVMVLGGFGEVTLGGAARYVEATNLARAVQLGLGIYGTTSFAILEGPVGPRPSRFWAVATTPSVSQENLGRESTPWEFEGEPVVPLLAGEVLRTTSDDAGNQYVIHAVVSQEKRPLTQGRAAAQQLIRRLRHAGSRLEPERVRQLVFADLDLVVAATLAGDEDRLEEAADRLAQLDLEAFSLVDWATKVNYLEVLIRAWTLERHERAIVEIMRSLDNALELKAVQAMLTAKGLFAQLFNDLDDQLWSLLTTVGRKFGDPGPITFDTFITLLEEAFQVPDNLHKDIQRALTAGAPVQLGWAVLAEVHEATLALSRFLVESLDSLKLLVTQPHKLLEGLGQLARLIVTFALAKYGYPPARDECAALLGHLGGKLADGFKGTAVLQVGEEVARTIKWALLVTAASWFVGAGELKAVAAGVGLTEKVAAVLRFLSILGKLADAEAEAELIARLARLARAMRQASTVLKDLEGEEEVLRLLSHLPEEDVARLGALLEQVEVAEGSTLASLVAHPELGPVAQESLRKVEVLQTLAKKSGGLTEELGAAFRRLAGKDGFQVEELAQVASALRDGEGGRFLAVLERIGFERIGPRAQVRADFLRLLAGDARRMNAVGAYGYDLLRAIFNRSAGEAEAFDAALENLRRLPTQLGGKEKAAEFRQLLDKLAQGDPEAWIRVGGTAEAATLRELQGIVEGNQKAQAGLRKLVRGGHDDVAYLLARESLSEADRARTVATLERLAELTDQQADGFATVMRLPAGSIGSTEREAILTVDRRLRDPLLELVGEVHGSVDDGLVTAIRRGLEGGPMDIQGTLGHFFAARTVKERFPGARLRFEVPAPRREIDIQMDYLGRRIDVEVKTNLGLEPTIDHAQIQKDLERHLGDRWQNMLYLYAPQQSANLAEVERAMLRVLQRLDALGKLPMPLTQAEVLLRARISAPRPWKLVDVFAY